MRRRTPLATLILLSLTAVVAVKGCKRKSSDDGPTTLPATEPTATAATTEPTVSVLTISNRPYEFRPARLIVSDQDSGEPGVLVQLFSERASPEGVQDGYYLEMTLDISDASQLDGASWQYDSKSKERADDTLSAITVNGGANQLQPKDVTATFSEVSADTVEIRLNGFFNVFTGRDGAVATSVVPIEATLLAKRQAAR